VARIFCPRLFFAIAIGMTVSGCGASVMSSEQFAGGEIITVNSTPAGANVVVKNLSGVVQGSGATPFQLRVSCSHTVFVTVSADGYDSQTVEDDAAQMPFGAGPFTLNLGGNACHKLAQLNVALKKQELE